MPEGLRSTEHPTVSFPAPMFSCVSTESQGTVRVTVTGELDLATAPRLEQVLEQANTPGEVVVVDLRRLEFIDSAGAHLLIGSNRRIRSDGGQMIVVRGTRMIAWFFELMGLDQELEVVESVPGPAAARGSGYGHAQAVIDALRRQYPDAVQARLVTSARLLEAMTGQRDELRARVACVEQELLDLVHQPPGRIGPPAVWAAEPA